MSQTKAELIDAKGDANFDSGTLYVDATNNRVGIGTTSPATALHVSGSGTQRIRITGTGTANAILTLDAPSGYVNYIEYGASAATPLAFYDVANTAERARIDSSGRLLVGTSSSSATAAAVLQGASGDPCNIYLQRPTTTPTDGISLGQIFFADSGGGSGARILAQRDGGTWTSGSSHPGRLVFSTTADGASSPTERMRIASNGRVFIATDTQQFAAANLTVLSGGISGIVSRNNTAGGWNLICGSASNSGTYYFAAFQRHDTSALIGQITSTNGTSTTYGTTSDYRLKENVQPLTGAVNRVKQLQPKRFNFIANTEETLDGFLAHEVDEVVPQAVIGSKDAIEDDGQIKPQCIDHSMLVPLLTAALQEAIGEIESLKARVAALESV